MINRAYVIMVGLLPVSVYVFYLAGRILRFWIKKAPAVLINIMSFAFAVLSIVCCANIWSLHALIGFHLVAFAALADVVALIVKRAFRNHKKGKHYIRISRFYHSGAIPVILTMVVLICGYINMQHPVRTEYQVETSKNVRGYKIVLLTDTHYGTIQDTDILKQKLKEISQENPDIVVLGGDIVEEKTPKDKMEEIFKLAGEIKTNYGVYYVYGNHDRQPYSGAPTFSDDELKQVIEKSGITILEDSYEEINDDLIIAGRADAAWGNTSGRDSVEKLLENADRNKYIIMTDHQPIEAEENDEQGVDLLLSGHTHAGQIWPIGLFTELSGALNYGEYLKGDCKVIVSSGFTGWGYPVRTQGHGEYVVINIKSV